MPRLSFSKEEYEFRLTAFQKQLRDRSVDIAIVTRSQNIYYLSGFRASHFASQLSELHALVVPQRGVPRLLTRALEKAVGELQWSPQPVFYMDHEDPFKELAKLIAEMAGSTSPTLGLEERFLSVRQYARITAAVPAKLKLDISGVVERIAVVPSRNEIACLRRAAAITQIGFEVGVSQVRVGRKPYQVVGAIHEAMYGAGQSEFDMSMVCVWGGATGGRMHDTDATEEFAAGDAVTIEIFGVDNQYKVGAQGTVFAGARPADRIAGSFSNLVRMFEAARSRIRAGVTAGEIFDAANGPYRELTGSDYYRKVGGTMGLTLFEIPLVKDNRTILGDGHCVLLQTLVDNPVLLTCSSSVLVGTEGAETLTDPVTALTVV